MIYEYGGRRCVITRRNGGVVKGFYSVSVDVDEVDADGNDVIGIDFNVVKSFWLEGIRNRVDSKGNITIAEEIELEVLPMVEKAKQRFRDAVDTEALSG